jgi:hypothetical protein
VEIQSAAGDCRVQGHPELETMIAPILCFGTGIEQGEN